MSPALQAVLTVVSLVQLLLGLGLVGLYLWRTLLMRRQAQELTAIRHLLEQRLPKS